MDVSAQYHTQSSVTLFSASSRSSATTLRYPRRCTYSYIVLCHNSYDLVNDSYFRTIPATTGTVQPGSVWPSGYSTHPLLRCIPCPSALFLMRNSISLFAYCCLCQWNAWSAIPDAGNFQIDGKYCVQNLPLSGDSRLYRVERVTKLDDGTECPLYGFPGFLNFEVASPSVNVLTTHRNGTVFAVPHRYSFPFAIG